jgi:hypothetical protein
VSTKTPLAPEVTLQHPCSTNFPSQHVMAALCAVLAAIHQVCAYYLYWQCTVSAHKCVLAVGTALCERSPYIDQVSNAEVACISNSLLAKLSSTAHSLTSAQIDQLIVNILEPAFTPSLLVTLGLSSVLGIFKIGQMQRSGVDYRE